MLSAKHSTLFNNEVGSGKLDGSEHLANGELLMFKCCHIVWNIGEKVYINYDFVHNNNNSNKTTITVANTKKNRQTRTYTHTHTHM